MLNTIAIINSNKNNFSYLCQFVYTAICECKKKLFFAEYLCSKPLELVLLGAEIEVWFQKWFLSIFKIQI